MSLLRKAFPLFEELYRTVFETTSTLKFDNENRQNIIAVSLHGSVLEIAFGILTVLRKNRGVPNGTAAWILLRSLLEALIDLLNIVADAGYDEVMHASYLDQQKRSLRVASTRAASNPFFKSLVADPAGAAQHAQWVQSELQRLKQAGVVPLSVKERFERAGQLNLYDGPYSILSSHTHSNLIALEGRHIELSPDGFDVHYFRDIPDEDTQMIIDSAAGAIANSLAAVKSLLEGNPPSGLEEVSEKLKTLRSLWKVGSA